MSVTTRLLLVAVTLFLVSFAATAGARAPGKPSGVQPGANCENTSSAINQYCENIPSAAGGSAPPGSSAPQPPALGTKLSVGAVRAYRNLPVPARKRARKLLALAAPARSVPVSASLSARKSTWSLPLGLVIAVAAVAIGGAGALLIRRSSSATGP